VALEEDMAKPEVYSDFEKLKRAQANFTKAASDLEVLTKRWEEILTEPDQFTN